MHHHGGLMSLTISVFLSLLSIATLNVFVQLAAIFASLATGTYYVTMWIKNFHNKKTRK